MSPKKEEEKNEFNWDYESQGGSLYKFEEVGQKVTGVLTDYHVSKTSLGDMHVYTLITSEGECSFAATSTLHQELKKFQPGQQIVQVELVDLKDTGKGNPFKVFKVRATQNTEDKRAALGIVMFGSETETADDDSDLPDTKDF